MCLWLAVSLIQVSPFIYNFFVFDWVSSFSSAFLHFRRCSLVVKEKGTQ